MDNEQIEIIPCHLHFFKEDRFAGYEAKFIEIMNRAGVRQVIVFGNDGQDETTADILVNFRNLYPERIFCVPEVNVNQNQIQAKMKELISKHGMSGFKIYPSKCMCYPDDEKMFDIYRCAVDLDVPLVFHSGRVPGDFKKYGLVKYAQPVYLDEVAARFPQLRIVISHAGNPMFEQTLMIGNRPNINIELTGVTGSWRENFPRLFERYGADRMLHGGPNHYHDRYFTSCCEDMLALLKEKEVGGDAIRKIMGMNAKRLFRLE